MQGANFQRPPIGRGGKKDHPLTVYTNPKYDYRKDKIIKSKKTIDSITQAPSLDAKT